jgi:(1->4)-alpha-D-glucan 1-alpha-D-glucosylmutase
VRSNDAGSAGALAHRPRDGPDAAVLDSRRARAPRDGAYVHYALDEMLAIVALESQRNRCLVIGEDLGTVADAMREALARLRRVVVPAAVFRASPASGGFRARSREYPGAALAAVSTHDLATLAGWWCRPRPAHCGCDLGLYPNRGPVREAAGGPRYQERTRLLLALRHAGLLDAGRLAVAAAASTSAACPGRCGRRCTVFLAGAPSAVLMVQLEDALSVYSSR